MIGDTGGITATEEDMAIVIILAGSLFGFLGGAAAYLFFDVSLMAAIAIWVGAGPASALVALALSLAPQPSRTVRNRLHADRVA